MSQYMTFRRGRLITPNSISFAPEFERDRQTGSFNASATVDLLANDHPEGADTCSNASNEPAKKTEPVAGGPAADYCAPRLKSLSKFYRIGELKLH